MMKVKKKANFSGLYESPFVGHSTTIAINLLRRFVEFEEGNINIL